MTEIADKQEGIAIESAPSCYLCGSPGDQLYQSRMDSLFGAPGHWDFRKCSNPKCQLIWMDPVPSPSDVSKLYSNYYTHRDNQARHISKLREAFRFVRDCYLAGRYGYVDLVDWWCRPIGYLLYLVPFRRSIVDFDIMCLHACPGGRLLEIGCGSGACLARMRRLGWEVQGVEPDTFAASIGRDTYGLDLYAGTLQQAGFPAESFDVITMNHVIEHVHDPLALLAECRRILRPGGRLVLTTPNTDSWGHKVFGRHWRGLEPPRHFMIFSLQNLEQCTKRSHFDTLALRSISRWGRDIFMASKEIEAEARPPFVKKAWARFQSYIFQTVQTIVERFSIWIGEEIYFVGQKPRSQ